MFLKHFPVDFHGFACLDRTWPQITYGNAKENDSLWYNKANKKDFNFSWTENQLESIFPVIVVWKNKPHSFPMFRVVWFSDHSELEVNNLPI